LFANSILNHGGGKETKVVHQIYRASDNGETGAVRLAELLNSQGVTVHNHEIAAAASVESVAKAIRLASSADALVLWLRPADVAKLGKEPVAPVQVYLSGLMAGLEQSPLPLSWRANTRLAYPFALQDQRIVNVDYALGWFRIRHIPVVAEQVQADTFLACSLLAETLKHMVDTFVPEYLVERVEDMLDRRIITGYYPRLTLATGQRFASKGGYIVRFANLESGAKLVADSEWIVP
jgi:hypothetical protein